MLIDCAPVEPWEKMHGTGLEPSTWLKGGLLLEFQTSLWNELITNTLALETAHAPPLSICEQARSDCDS